MANTITYIPYAATGSFSPLVNDYLACNERLKPFYDFPCNESGIDAAIQQRKQYPVNRPLLQAAIARRYANVAAGPEVIDNIDKLVRETTFTICTAHQPNLLTGYLYFIYKIVHAIKMAAELNAKNPDLHFVPIYYMGSEDNDLEELGTFRFRGQKFRWESDQKGAVGRMTTGSLTPVLKDLFQLLGPPGKECDQLKELIQHAYQQQPTIADATFYLVNQLFGRFGLLIVNPDDAALKSAFLPVIEEELLQQSSYPIVTQQAALLGANYKIQANPREINLFYLADQLRERIERNGETWRVVNTDIEWTQDEVLAELRNFPERFSPNVVLRALFQETILPDVAFIGGGAEVAYWLQLKTLFRHHHVFYPAIMLRQSVQLFNNEAEMLLQLLHLKYTDVFKPTDILVKQMVKGKYGESLSLTATEQQIIELFDQIKEKAKNIDPTLEGAAIAAAVKTGKAIKHLEKKMLSAACRNETIVTARVQRLKNILYPSGSLQERTENFMEPFLEQGHTFTDALFDAFAPFGNEFLILGTA